MKKALLSLLLFISATCLAQDWKYNVDEAKALAERENKNIVLVFSGSDWCAPCIKLDRNIWQSDEFKNESSRKWVLLKADFPKKKQNALPQPQQEHNDKLAEKYNQEGNFPLVVVIDKTGKVLGKTGFKNISPKEYIALLHSFEK
ncbi:thioredoxin family protein [Flavobacterium alkalisoli]|uniref:Thioredoxin family protein n=1 Tax=Flavobacterium alkalisoli TaxID=2602769 RepID=A0A5B9FZL8_9FLAO|nr:thioredoxin family protein [Flavobacterium alkalisoli]QEE50442.1 thioredoxin family protein [Flavobacterium alkalisoli]